MDDETWTKTNMTPLRGWAARGARLVAKVPHGHWKTMTFVAALRHDRIEAPFVLDGPINGECFKTYVEKVLAPTLAPGDLVIMCKILDLRFQALPDEITTCHSSLGGEFGEWIDVVKDAQHRLRRREHSGKSGIPDLQKMLASLTTSSPPRR